MSEKVLKVLSNVQQGLTETQKAQARSNIGCAGAYTAGTGIAINDHSIINTAPNVKADWNAAAGTSAEILNKPTIPTVNDGSLTIQVNGTQLATFSANQSGNVTANITVPTDTTYTAGSGISISDSNVITNTMHQDTYGLMISYNTLVNSGTTTHSIGPWRIQVTKAAMTAWDDSADNSLHIAFAHTAYLDGSVVNGHILVDTLTPWADGLFSTVYTAHNQWGFLGTFSQGGSNNGFGLQLISPDADPDGIARACPRTMRGYHFVVNCGINAPDWLECDASLLYVNNNTSLTSNAARLLLRFKYFYV